MGAQCTGRALPPAGWCEVPSGKTRPHGLVLEGGTAWEPQPCTCHVGARKARARPGPAPLSTEMSLRTCRQVPPLAGLLRPGCGFTPALPAAVQHLWHSLRRLIFTPEHLLWPHGSSPEPCHPQSPAQCLKDLEESQMGLVIGNRLTICAFQQPSELTK